MKKIIVLTSLIIYIILCVSCSKIKGNGKLVIYSPHTEKLINSIVEEFKAKNPGIEVEVIRAGSGELLSKIETEKNHPLGDVLWGGSLNTVKIKMHLFDNYISTNENFIDAAYKNTEGSMTRFSSIPSVIMINTNLTSNVRIWGYNDVLNTELKGKIAFANPTLSSSSFDHLVNMLYAMGNGEPQNGWWYVKALYTNLEGKLLNSSSTVYKGVAEGKYAVGLTFEEGAANYSSYDSPIKLVYMQEGVIFKPDVICIISKAKNMNNARKFVDFCTSYEVQKTLNDRLNRRSVRNDLTPSPTLKEIDEINVIADDEDQVKTNKNYWLNEFHHIFLGNFSK